MTPEERLEVLLKAVEKFGRPVTTRNWSSTPGVR
jgi:hypothetical protein